jgi:hypothetical protein
MSKATVAGSYNKFLTDASEAGIRICEVYDASKDWIKHFIDTLSPSMPSFVEPGSV